MYHQKRLSLTAISVTTYPAILVLSTFFSTLILKPTGALAVPRSQYHGPNHRRGLSEAADYTLSGKGKSSKKERHEDWDYVEEYDGEKHEEKVDFADRGTALPSGPIDSTTTAPTFKPSIDSLRTLSLEPTPLSTSSSALPSTMPSSSSTTSPPFTLGLIAPGRSPTAEPRSAVTVGPTVGPTFTSEPNTKSEPNTTAEPSTTTGPILTSEPETTPSQNPSTFPSTFPTLIGPTDAPYLFTTGGDGGDLPFPSAAVESSDSAVFCPGTTVNRQQSVWWTYSLTMNSTSSGVEDADASVEALEPLLRFNLLDLLECNNPTRRRLASDYGILGMDYLPDDLREEACQTTTALPCFIFRGELFLYLAVGANADVAIYETRRAIRDLMSEAQAFSIPQVALLKYLAPDLSNPSSLETTDNGSQTLTTEQVNSTTAITVLSAVGGLMVVVAMVAAYRFRRNKDETEDGPSTIAPGSTITTGNSSTSNNPGTPSPAFTSMLPGAYRMRSPYAMSAILEDSSDTASYSRDSDIIVSECGYTDDGSSTRDPSYLNSRLHDENKILGARAMEAYDSEDEFSQDNSHLHS